MADNDNDNDEYKFDELDSFNNEPIEHEDYGASMESPSTQPSKPPQKNIRRNALIAVGVIVLAMILYKLFGGLFSGKNNVPKGNVPPVPVAAVTPPQIRPQPQSAIAPQPMTVPQPVAVDNALKQKVDSIEVNQRNVQSQVASMNEQVNTVNNNVSNLSAQISQLNQTIADLTHQLSRQSEEINILMARTKPKPIRRPVPPRLRGAQANVYYISAVIPGRAWLIGTNGSTLTVREGTKIAGYGVVRLIDSMEGRILTSSGRIIRFSQADS